MAKKPTQHKSRSKTRSQTPGNKPKQTTGRKKAGGTKKPGGTLLWIGLGIIETAALLTSGLAIMLLVFGLLPKRFTGTDPVSNLLPFLASVVVLCGCSAVFLILWWKLRGRFTFRSGLMPALLALAILAAVLVGVPTSKYQRAYSNLRIMVGGKKEADRVTLAHQVYAAYRRHSQTQLQKLTARSDKYSENIYAAAKSFNLDPDLLFGIAAAESSFYPRKSGDGGIGLFQLTSVPRKVSAKVDKLLPAKKEKPAERLRNAYLAAGILDYYIDQMKGDLFLGLLAYNIGPKNGGLRFIMDQYNVTDFISIQPYLQQGPRNYPIRVLSYALAFRLYHRQAGLLPYEEGENALRIQQIGIPALGGL